MNNTNLEIHECSLSRNRKNWSQYVVEMIEKTQHSVRRNSDINNLRILQYPSGLLPQHITQIKKDDEGVVWL